MIHALALTLALGGAAQAAEVSVASAGHAFNPSWSPDGQWIAFELNQYEGSIDLYVVKIQNGNPIGTPQKLSIPGSSSSFSSGGSMAAAPNWHPQGFLIFEGSNPGGTNRLYFWKPGGQSAAELLNSTQISGDLSWPAISPDGKLVSFVSDSTGSGDLYTWNRGDNKVTAAITSPFSEMAPRYNDSGTKLAYSRKNRGGEDLFTWEAGQSTPQVGGNGDQTRPVWSGDSMVFFSNERGEDHWDIAISASVGDKRIIARDVRLPLRSTPALTPDGQWVAYGMSDPGKAHAIAVSRIDGSKTVEIDTGLVACGEPSLVSVGERVFLAYTALPSEGADWRKLQVMDITDKLR